MGLRVIALAWGLAEAVLFFIVPDVLLSAVALRRLRLALKLCLWALLGALAGGALMYAWGSQSPETMTAALACVPAVSEAMIARVVTSMDHAGAWAMFIGPLIGTPYKLYAGLAPVAGVGLPAMLLISIPARLVRFIAVACLTAWILRRWLGHWSDRRKYALLLGFWAIFYTAFLWLMPW